MGPIIVAVPDTQPTLVACDFGQISERVATPEATKEDAAEKEADSSSSSSEEESEKDKKEPEATNKDDIQTISAPSNEEEKIEDIEEVLEEKCKEEVETKTDASLIQAEVKVVPEETDIQENKDASSSSSSSSSDNEEEEIKTVEEEKVDVVTVTKDDILEDLKEAKESEITIQTEEKNGAATTSVSVTTN